MESTRKNRVGLQFKALGIWLLLPCLSAAGSDVRLANAAQRRDSQAVRSLLAEHADVNAAQPDGATALAWAAHWNDLETADLLLRAGADANAANDYGVSPLSLACVSRSAAMIGKLLEAGADPDAAQENGETALMTCAHTGSVEAVKLLLARGADVNAKESWQGQTALMWAVSDRHPQAAKALIDGGADVPARSQGGFTALLFAAQQGDIESARVLLAAGANIDEAGPGGMTPAVLATASGHGSLAASLLEENADPNLADSRGYTALHYAASRRNLLDLVKALLAHGADPNARITKHSRRAGSITLVGATPLLLAAEAGNIPAIRALAAAGGDPLIPTSESTTALLLAIGAGKFQERPESAHRSALETAKVMLELGNDVNATGEFGWTPMHAAAYLGSDEIIRFLSDRGAKLDVMDGYGQTPLSIASAVITKGMADYADPRPRRYRKSTVELLLQLGATPVAASGVESIGSLAVSQE